jgi:hypothetical protein
MDRLARTAFAALLVLAVAGARAQAGTRYVATWLESSKGWGAVVADFDGDGHDDLFVTGHDRDDRLWFATPTGHVPGRQVLPFVDRHACAAADVNRDGRLDLYCAVGAVQGTGAADNELWLQRPDGTFQRAVGFGAEDPYGRSRRPVFFDFDHDGWPDLYDTNEATVRSDGQVNVNHVFVNQGGTGFVERTTKATGAMGYECAGKGDVDGDGWDDLVTCSDPASPGHVFVNTRGGDFIDLATPATAVPWADAQLADVDGDGRDDLVVVNTRHVLQVWRNTGTAPYFTAATFTAALPGRGVSLAVGDFDGNGRKDIYVVLDDPDCRTTLVDLAPDLVFWGQPGGGYVAQAQPQQYAGCGHLAATVDGDKILLEQGGEGWRGPNYLIRWKPLPASR